MYFILFKAHSGLRWLVAAVVLLLIARLLILLSTRGEFRRKDESIVLAFTALFDLQLLIGLSLLLWDALEKSFLPLYRIEHSVTLLVAAGLAHLPRRWKRAEAAVRVRRTLVLVIAVSLLVVVGVMRLPQGW